MKPISPAAPRAPVLRDVPDQLHGTRAAIFHLWRQSAPAPGMPRPTGHARASFLRTTDVRLTFQPNPPPRAPDPPDSLIDGDRFVFARAKSAPGQNPR